MHICHKKLTNMKLLTEDDVVFKSPEYYYSMKKKFNYGKLGEWYEKIGRTSRSIGYVSALLKRLHPQSHREAYEMYIESGKNEKDKGLDNRGRDYDELEALAMQWRSYSNTHYQLVEYYDALVLHAVIETFDGLRKEEIVFNGFLKYGFDTSYTEGSTDSTCGVDIIAKKNGKTFLVQVKTLSYFYGHTPKLESDRRMIFTAEPKRREIFGPDAVFVWYIYDPGTDMWMENRYGKGYFRTQELMNENGSVVNDIDAKLSKKKNKLY